MTKQSLSIVSAILLAGLIITSGCSSGLFQTVQPWPENNVGPYGLTPPPGQANSPVSTEAKRQNLESSYASVSTVRSGQQSVNPSSNSIENRIGSSNRRSSQQPQNLTTLPAKSHSDGFRNSTSPTNPRLNRSPNRDTQPNEGLIFQAAPIAAPSDQNTNTNPINSTQHNSAKVTFGQSVVRGQSPDDEGAVFIPSTFETEDQIRQTALQNPELQTGPEPFSPFQRRSIDIGGPNELNPFSGTIAPAGSAALPRDFADINVIVGETSTGRINVGGAFNSDNGLVGQFVVDERNFDLFRLPRNFREIVDGTAWRGAGQAFRLELVPGSDVERYLVNFSEPFLGGTRVSFSTSLFYFQRQFFDFDEERIGGRFNFGYRLTPDLSVSAGIRLENVELSNPRNLSSPTLNATLGDSDLYVANIGFIHDTRDHPFLPTQGMYTALTLSQGFGEFDFSRANLDLRTYRLIYERPDGSGRHTLSFGTRLGFSGSQTPIFENFFAGGFSTLRGFDFRGASPLEGDIRVGGEFQWLNSLEYTFPITPDDMVKGVLFTDFGTVEENIEIDSDNFRVAPGFGFRVSLPAAGIGAPLAFDFAFPVAEADGDDQQVFTFNVGVSR